MPIIVKCNAMSLNRRWEPIKQQVREKRHDIVHHGSNRIHGIRQRFVDDGSEPYACGSSAGLARAVFPVSPL